MKYSRTAITQLSKWYKQVLIKCAILNAAVFVGFTTVPVAVSASEINQNNVPFKTETTIEQNNNVFNISTTTTNSKGDIGVNSFGKFNLSQGDMANLNLINDQNKLVNLVFDDSASQIDGIVNSYKNGQIGGNVLFANPNGFVVGKTGVFNVGSLTLITPTESFMRDLLSGSTLTPVVVEDTLNSLVTFKLEGSDYLLLGGGVNAAVKLNPAEIKVQGTINSGSGIDIINGGNEINIEKDAKLNTNMEFSANAEKITTKPKTSVTPSGVQKTAEGLQYKLSIDGGNGITIVSQNQKTDGDFLSAIVNLDGNIDSNGSDVLVQTEIYNSGIKSAQEYDKENKHDVAVSGISVDSNADIKGRDVALNARTEVTSINKDLISSGNEFVDCLGPNAANFIISDFFHMADMKSSVDIKDGAKITAEGTLSANANTTFVASSTSIMENLAFNYTDVDIVTESVLRSGANIKAENINVSATTNMQLTSTTTATNIAEKIADAADKSFGHGGAYAITVSLLDVINRAVVEKNVNLDVEKNMTVDAQMYRTYLNTTKNGFIPVIDSNFGTAGIGVSVSIANTKNEAIMDSSVNLSGTLDVEANYIGATNQSIYASSLQKGEGSQFGLTAQIFMFFKDYFKHKYGNGSSDISYNRANGVFDKLKVAGAVGVAIDNVDNRARIGDTTDTTKPIIKAGNINLNSSLLDNKSNLYVSSVSSNGENSVAGAVAVNVKNLNSNADAYGDFTIKGNENASEGFVIKSSTTVKHGLSYRDWIPDLFDWTSNLFYSIFGKKKNTDVESITSADARDYISATTKAEDIQKQVDGAGNLNILNAIDFNVLGAAQLFNTFASSSASAASKDQQTSAYSGAVAVAVNNTSSNAMLHNNSSVLFQSPYNKQNNTLRIDAYTNNQQWSGAAMMGVFNNIMTGGGGAAARDGDYAGGAITFQMGEAVTTAKIGKNVTVSQENLQKAGDVIVNAFDESDNINVSIANGLADESGLSGAISISAIDDGLVEASIASSDRPNAINASNVNVNAQKDLTHVNANVAASSAQDAKGIGVALNYANDKVISSIAGNVNALNDVMVNANYDKLFINGAINVGYAQTGTDTPKYGNLSDEEHQANFDTVNQLLDRSETLKNNGSFFKSLWNLRNANAALQNSEYDFTRAINTDKNTAAKAGIVSASMSETLTKAFIADKANVLAGKDIKISANSEDMLINGALAMAVHGKSGMGGGLVIQYTGNEVEASIGNAVVDAAQDISVNAQEDLKLFSGAMGSAQGSDNATAGNISVDIQQNKITAAIKDNAKVNTNTDTNKQSVLVNAKLKNDVIKGIGTISLQTSGNGNSIGATLDGDIALNEINAYIKDSDVNAGKNLDISAQNEINLITVDAAGSVAVENSAFSGTLAVFASENTENSYIENSKINQTNGRQNKDADISVTAISTFDDLAIVGTVAYGSKSSADASVRVDGVVDSVNSYIKNSVIDTTRDVKLYNKSEFDSLIVSAAGTVSQGNTAASGSVSVLIDNAKQNNYIENSEINTNSLDLNSDAIFNTLGITGALTANTKGAAYGGSVYVAAINNDVNTYILNSSIISQSDITLASDYNSDILNISFGGVGGKGLALSGSVNTVVNDSKVNTYIKSEEGKKNTIKSQEGKVLVQSQNNVNIKAINTAVAASFGAASGGASINAIVDNNEVYAAIDGANVKAKKEVTVNAVSNEDIMSIAIGSAGGTGFAASGSVNSLVLDTDVKAHINNSQVESTEDNVSVVANGTTNLTGGTGNANIATSAAALGGTIVRGVINNAVSAKIEDSKVNANNNIVVSATENENIGSSSAPLITVAGGYAHGVSGEGVINTILLNGSAEAFVTGTKTIENNIDGLKAGNDISIKADGSNSVYTIGGSVGGSAAVGIGATINTILIDKKVNATAKNTKLDADNIDVTATEKDDLFTVTVATAGAGTGGASGIVNTNTITSDISAGIKNSIMFAKNNIKTDANAIANIQTITGEIAGGGVAGVGLSFVNNTTKYNLASYLENADAMFNNLDVNANTDITYKASTISGAAAGTAVVTGVENVNQVNNSVKAYATGNLKGENANIKAKDSVLFTDSYSGVLGIGGTAGIGGTVEVNSVTSNIYAYLGGENVAINNININAEGEQNFNNITAIGLEGSGVASFTGTALSHLINTTVKAYVEDNTKIAQIEQTNDGVKEKAINSLNIDAKNSTSITENIGAISVAGKFSVGPSVAVNKIYNNVEAYTGDNVTVNAKNVTINAKSENIVGKEDNKALIFSGSIGGYVGVAASILYTDVKDIVKAFVGENNTIGLADEGKLDASAINTTQINENLGDVGFGAVGGGGTVGWNNIENTVLSYIGSKTDINGSKADVIIQAQSNETIDATGLVISGGGVALSGGVLYSSIGKQVGNPSYVDMSAENQELFISAQSQADETSKIAEDKIAKADSLYKDAYNDVIIKTKESIDEASDSRINNLSDVTDSLFTKTEVSGTHSTATDMIGSTSSFVDAGANLFVKDLNILAQNTNDIKFETSGGSIGAVAGGISAAISDNNTTTNAFLSNDALIKSKNFSLSAFSNDIQNLHTIAVDGGVVNLDGSVAKVYSNKTTNAYILHNTEIEANEDINVKADSKSKITTDASSGTLAAVNAGVSKAHSTVSGSTKVSLADNVSLSTQKGNVQIKTLTDETVNALSNATNGGGIAGGGGESIAKISKYTGIEINKNFETDIYGDLILSSAAKNEAFSQSNGRAYGGISAGGTSTLSEINQISGIRINDSDTQKDIIADNVLITSNVTNNANTDTIAGAGSVAGGSGSEATNNIVSQNDIYVGKNYNVLTKGGYALNADTLNIYKGSNLATAFGVVAVSIPKIRNNVNSAVSVDSKADINSNSGIVLKSSNEILKEAVSGYDLYGGAGGLADGSGGSINDNLQMVTTTIFGGNKAYDIAEYGKGGIDIGAYNKINVNEKADLYSYGVIPGADTDSIVRANTNAEVKVSNKDIQTENNNINYTARNDVDIYTKSNVESYGGVAGAGGISEATIEKQQASVIFEEGVKSLSKKDTNISAINNTSLEAYIYAETGGALSFVAGEARAHNKDSKATVTINSGAEIESFDKIDIKSLNTSQKIKAERDALAYELGFIPYHGSGNEYTTDENSAQIVLNGSIESGTGSIRTRIINQDGTVDSESNISVKKEVIGSITASDIDADIQSYINSKNDMTTAYNEYIASETTRKNNYQKEYDNANTQKNNLKNENVVLINNKNTAETTLNTVTGALNDINNIGTEAYATNYGTVAEVQQLIAAYENIETDSQAYDLALSALTNKQAALNGEIYQYTTKINENNKNIRTSEDVMTSALNNINQIDSILTETTNKYEADVGSIQTKIAELEARKAELTSSDMAIHSMIVEDVIIRSGEVNLTGDVTGTGSITAIGNSFTIDIQNYSTNNIIYGDLIIDRDLKGGIYGDNIASSITQNVVNGNGGTKISVVNHVSANDPTVNNGSNAGDIIFRGNIENASGTIEVINNTGSVLSEGNLKAKHLSIKVPNGNFNQQYTSTELEIGGANANGAIIATGDINIAAKTIDVNGLIQSGSEIKEINIPDLSIIKEGDTYYQIVNGVKTLMTESQTGEGYYYLTLTDNTSDLAELQQIKAYFKPTDTTATENITGDIYLFKANIEGGNITLTGNIVSSSDTGKIVLLNGYGHINIVNNSNYNLVTNALNADTKAQGKLTINDFKFASEDGGETFSDITQSDLDDTFLSENAGKYEAYVENANIITSANGNTEGNGLWSNETSVIVRDDGAKIYSTTYTPGEDAYTMTSAGGTYSYQVYEPRSWLVELFTGKQYKTVSVSYDPVYEVKNNAITVDFQGFDKPEINITSTKNANILLNNNISATNGDINITSNGSILSNGANALVSADNINLSAQNNIGQTLTEDNSVIKAVQVEVLNNGTLSASGKDLYINYPYTQISNININAAGNVYIASGRGNFNGIGKNIDISANTLELRADDILLDTTQNENIAIDVQELKARAKNDISITNKGDLVVSSIVSENNGKISLESKEGSIIAGNTKTYSPYHINGGNIYLRALNGAIGSKDASLKFANNGVYNVEAKNSIYLDSVATMYVDNIQSNYGNVGLNASFGIIASAISDKNKDYNLFSNKDLYLTSASGNIENLEVKTNGTINATAGYNNDTIEGFNSINIHNVSDEDMKIGAIKASGNATLTSNKGVQNATDISSVTGEHIAIKANGDIGTKSLAINLNASKGVTVLSKGGGNIYLYSDDVQNGLKLNKIDTNNGQGSLGTVEISSVGDISNASEKLEKTETANIKAQNIKLTAGEGKNIGSTENSVVVFTTSDKSDEGLEYMAQQAYIKGIGDVLNISNGTSVENAVLEAQNNIIASNLISKNSSINVLSNNEAKLNNITVGKDLTISSSNVKIDELISGGNLNATADNILVNTSQDVIIGTIKGLNDNYVTSLDIVTDKNILNGKDSDDANIFAKNVSLTAGQSIGEDGTLSTNLARENNVSVVANNLANINNMGDPVNYSKIAAKDVVIIADNAVKITDLNTDTLSLITKSKNINITGDIKSKGTIQTADKKVVIGGLKDKPDYKATLQLSLIKRPMHLNLDGSRAIQTDFQNVVRYSKNVFIVGHKSTSSMENEILLAHSSLIHNPYYRTFNNYMGITSNIKDHYKTDLIDENIITNHNNELVNADNIFETINQTK